MTDNVLEKTSPWDNETFDRVPADLFDDSFWDDGKFTRKEAFIDLYPSLDVQRPKLPMRIKLSKTDSFISRTTIFIFVS